MSKTFKLSQAKYDQLREELTWLKTVRVDEIAQLVKEARSFGDLSENSEYDEARNEQGKTYARIAEVETILSNYEIVDEEVGGTSEVHIGSSVTLDYGDGFPEELKVVGSQEADPMNMLISDESPLGRALLGKRLNDTVTYETPSGTISCKIIALN
ncbi:MAG: transcription elongation factor GreA [Clostridia bacterium]|nr:transcription elongation factor GreA [Clostridia bacterium]